jgi:hypothetical protein
MAKGVAISWKEEGIEIVGRITQEGFTRLIGYYNELVDKARAQEVYVNWPPPKDPWIEPPFVKPTGIPSYQHYHEE